MSKILIVEDNDSFRRSLNEILSVQFPRIAIAEAADGNTVLEKVNALLPELIFMDIKLPGRNGLDLTKEIKKDYSNITVIILTGYDLPEYRQAAFQAGADHFISKGTTSDIEIVALVESILFNPGLSG